MIKGFALLADTSTKMLHSADDLAEAWQDEQAIVWLDLEDPTESEVHGLTRVIKVEDSALEDSLHGEQRPRIDEYDDHILLVLYGALGPDDGDEFLPRKITALCGARFLITVHRHPLRTTRALQIRLERNHTNLLGRGIGFLLYLIIDMVVDNYLVVVDGYEQRLEDLEEISQDPLVDASILAEILDLRHDLLRLRSIASSQMDLLAPLEQGECDYVSEALGQRFSHVRDHLAQVIDLVDRLRELLGGVRDNYHAALATRTNEIVKMLTVYAAVLLPLSLIAGVYGMNLPIWPAPESPWSFWVVIGAMLAIGACSLAFFRWRRWI